jgi:hypothetical protein
MGSRWEVPKWLDMAGRKLEAGDVVKFTWPGSYKGAWGYIVLSKEKMLFVEEHGLIRTSYEIPLELPYKDIDKVETEGNRVEITGIKGEKYLLTSEFASSSLKSAIQNLMKSEREAVPA